MAKKRGGTNAPTGTKFPKVSPRGSKGKNTGGTTGGGGRRPMGSNHHGGAVGKRNSG